MENNMKTGVIWWFRGIGMYGTVLLQNTCPQNGLKTGSFLGQYTPLGSKSGKQ